jgi:transcriptional regulator with XRE-family HTH domain
MDHDLCCSSIKVALKQMRLDAQMTQKQLATRLNKPQSFVSKYENGSREIEFVTVYYICKALGKSLQEFQDILESYIQ